MAKIKTAPNHRLYARLGDDIAFATVGYALYDVPRQVWFAINDRDLYKPKEEVHIKGLLRYLEADLEKGWHTLEIPQHVELDYEMYLRVNGI
jgi:hypothetical protein